MTIAVGVLANGGVVLAADTQLTVQNFWKGESGKIMAVAHRDPKRPTGACAITGATSLYDFLHGLGDELWKDFEATVDDADKETAYERFEGIVHDFHVRHVAPEADRPEVSVLIAYQRNGDTALWQSVRSKLVEQYEYGAVGIGSLSALSWMSKLWRGKMDIPASIIAATFATAVAKESVDGCGKFTHVLVMEADQFRRIDQETVNEIDALYEALSSEIQPAFVMECLGNESSRTPRISRDDLVSRIGAVKTKLRDSTPETVRQWRRQRFERLATEPGQPPSTETS